MSDDSKLQAGMEAIVFESCYFCRKSGSSNKPTKYKKWNLFGNQKTIYVTDTKLCQNTIE